MQLLEESSAREAERFQFERELKRQEADRASKKFGWEEEDRTKNAPVLDAQRQDALATADFNTRTRKHTESEWAYQDRERAAEQPVKDAERRSRLSTAEALTEANDLTRQSRQKLTTLGTEALKNYEAEREKSIFADKDANGKETFTVDGRTFGSRAEAEKVFEEKRGSFTDWYVNGPAKQMRDYYISIGALEQADAFAKWTNDKRIQKGIEAGGMLLQDYHIGNWEGMSKNFNALMSNSFYMPQYDVKAEPIIEEGKPSGIRVVRKSEDTGQTFTQEFRDLQDGELVQAISGITNPATVFLSWMEQYKQSKEAAYKAREKNLEAAGALPIDMTKKIPDLFTKLREGLDQSADPEMRKLSPKEKDEYAMQQAQEVVRRSMGGTAPGARPVMPRQTAPQQQPVPPLLSRQPQASGPALARTPVPTPAPVGRSAKAYMQYLGIQDDPELGLADYERRLRLDAR